jgi:hypothetical protein
MYLSVGAPWFLAAILIVAGNAFRAQAETSPPKASNLRAVYDQLSSRFAESAPGWRPQVPATGSLLFIAPDQYTPAGSAGDQSRDQRNRYADALVDLARQAADAGELSLALQWTTEAAREYPDHAAARRALGYQQRDGEWLTPYAARMADAGKTWHPKFGWIAAADAKRYEAGERLVGGRWLSAADDAARHARLTSGWQMRTDHFLVTTNHSLEAAVELAARLERLYQVWRQLFAGFYMTEREVEQLFAGEREPRPQVRPFRVYYHRDHDQYVAALRRRQPRIAETLGIYFDTHREAHFFAGDNVASGNSPAVTSTHELPGTAGTVVATLYHEAAHQLFQESKRSAARIGEDANFWIIEGIATYFETLTEHRDAQAGLYYTVGEATAGRLPAARERLHDGYYVPLAELSRLGKSELQRRPDIAKLYSQAAGLSAFLMDSQEGRYREPLVEYLQAVYAGRDNAQSLPQTAAATYEELDAQYRRYIESLP